MINSELQTVDYGILSGNKSFARPELDLRARAALAARWGWKAELSDGERQQVTAPERRAELPERS